MKDFHLRITRHAQSTREFEKPWKGMRRISDRQVRSSAGLYSLRGVEDQVHVQLCSLADEVGTLYSGTDVYGIGGKGVFLNKPLTQGLLRWRLWTINSQC